MHVNCLTWSVLVHFYLQILLEGYFSLWCRNSCYNKFGFRRVYVGVGGMSVESLVHLFCFLGRSVDCDSPAKFGKFNIVSMGSRTNLSDFVL